MSDFNDELISPESHWTRRGATREQTKLLRFLNGERNALPKDTAPPPTCWAGRWDAVGKRYQHSQHFVRVVSLGRFDHRCVITPSRFMSDDNILQRVRERLAVAKAIERCSTLEQLEQRRDQLGTPRLDEHKVEIVAAAHFESVAEQTRQANRRFTAERAAEKA